MAAKMPLERIGEIMQAMLRELKRAGGEARPKQLFERVEPTLHLTDHERETYAKSGHTRWKAFAYFYSINLKKAGYIEKQGGSWRLTPEGEKALALPPGDFIRGASPRGHSRRGERLDIEVAQDFEDATVAIDLEAVEQVERQTTYESAKEQARTEIEDHISNVGPYDFQRVVAELLVGMGYHVPYIAPPGRDGGIDLIAYRDPLGVSTPRIRVQVKHRKEKVSVSQVRELVGVLHKDDDIGLIVSSGGFTPDAEREARSSTKHIETMDLDRLIGLWEQHYDHIPESGKRMIPLVRLYFLAPVEE